jgi:hypothetical protein
MRKWKVGQFGVVELLNRGTVMNRQFVNRDWCNRETVINRKIEELMK